MALEKHLGRVVKLAEEIVERLHQLLGLEGDGEGGEVAEGGFHVNSPTFSLHLSDFDQIL